jgi:flagellar motor protein MotB
MKAQGSVLIPMRVTVHVPFTRVRVAFAPWREAIRRRDQHHRGAVEMKKLSAMALALAFPVVMAAQSAAPAPTAKPMAPAGTEKKSETTETKKESTEVKDGKKMTHSKHKKTTKKTNEVAPTPKAQ